METVSAALTSFPPLDIVDVSDKELDHLIREHISLLQGLGTKLQEAALAKPEQVLQLLDPSVNSIAYLAVIDILVRAIDTSSSSTSSAIDRNGVLDATLRFILTFDPRQVRYAGSSFLMLLERVGSGTLFTPRVSIELLAHAILRVDPSGSMFTSTHLMLVNLAFHTTCTAPALRVIERDLLLFPGVPHSKVTGPLCDRNLPPTAYISTSTGLTREVQPALVLEYNLVCGLIFMSTRDWTKAKKSLERAVTHPSKDKGVSKITTEAYKKWLLVGLLAIGKQPSLPSYTAHSTKVACMGLAEAYQAVSSLFNTTDAAELRNAVQRNQNVWAEDGNTALVAEVLAAYQKWQIINLRLVYSQLPISQIQALTLNAETGEPLQNTGEVAALIRNMIQSGMLKAEYHESQGDDFLEFLMDRDLLTEDDFAREIAQSHASISSLAKDYKLVNDRLSASKDYVRQAVREQKRTEKEAENPSGNFETQIEDEDLMTGIIAHG